MKPEVRQWFAAALCLCLAFAFFGFAQEQPARHDAPLKEKLVGSHASGTFEVKATPQAADASDDSGISRFSLDKHFHGDLEGTSKGQMLSTGTAKSSGAYVAIERVSGTLKGRSGTFALQHMGTMIQGTPELKIAVVPDSGTGQLTGLSGRMNIKIDAGKHSYEFEYTLPTQQ